MYLSRMCFNKAPSKTGSHSCGLFRILRQFSQKQQSVKTIKEGLLHLKKGERAQHTDGNAHDPLRRSSAGRSCSQPIYSLRHPPLPRSCPHTSLLYRTRMQQHLLDFHQNPYTNKRGHTVAPKKRVNQSALSRSESDNTLILPVPRASNYKLAR